MYDASSLDYRPVSHGDTMSRGHQGHVQGSAMGYAGERRDRSSGYGQQGLLTQHGNGSGNLSLLDRRTSYGNTVDNRKSMQVHVGMGDDESPVGYAMERRQRTRDREREREYAY
jgi:hypothetical protein